MGVNVEICLDNKQGNFQLRRFITSENIERKVSGLLFWLTLYSAELRPRSVTQKKKLEAAHCTFQRSQLLRNKIQNKEVRKKTALQHLELNYQEKKTEMVWACLADWWWQTSVQKQVTHWEALQCEGQEDRERAGLTQ